MPFTTCASSTPVSRTSSPRKRYVNRVVVDAQAVQDRRVQVAQVDRVLDDVVAEVVGLAVLDAGLHAAAGQPHGEAAAVMVAAHAGVAERALAEHGAAELGGEDHQRVVQQAALLQVLHQRRGRLIDVAALVRQLPRDGDVLVPAAVEELHEPHAALEQPPGRAGSWPRSCPACGPPGRRSASVAAVSPLMSVSSGTDVCMRNAIS